MSTIIDAHCHVWPDAVAPKALGDAPTALERYGDGTVASLDARMREAGIDRAVCLGVAPAPKYVEATNAFLGTLDPERYIGFGSIHPGLSPEENLESLRRHKLRGVKVHPLFQNYSLDDPAFWATLEALGSEFPVTIHVGDVGHRADDSGDLCTPAMLGALARRFPELPIIACHFGGYLTLDEAEDSVIGLPSVYLDTSWPPTVGEVGVERLQAVIERHGPERVIFASDWPMSEPRREVEVIRSLGLAEDVTDGILGGNLARLLDSRSS